MQFSIFSVADHYTKELRTIRELYGQILDEIELADELGFSVFFLAEHHAERVRASLKRFAREVIPNFVESGSSSAS